jgi:LCP family protein required for cell wall assembly
MFGNETFEETEEGVAETPIGERVKVIFEYSEERENQDIITLTQSQDKTLTEPFTVLVMGVDSTLDGLKANQAFNGDTLILATFNPNTLTATMFSLPRDLYVPIACNNNRYAKINSSAAYGSSCVINTVQQLTDIEIDYYVKINFTGVVKLIDALGGVTVDVEVPDFQYNSGTFCKGMVCEQNSKRKRGKNMVYIPTGVQKLDGEQALAYARNRHQYALGDISRNQHQQQVIEATAKEAKNINSITEFENILETVSNNIETNMSLEQILSFYTVGKDMLLNANSSSLSIKKTYLSYYNLGVWQPGVERHTSALGYYPGSLDAIKKLMKENLELVEPTPIKTFDITYNEEYTTPLVGKGITTGARLELVKSFVGATQYEASAWCKTVGLTCKFETTTDYQTAGLIVNQSAHQNELVKSLSKITFYISDGKGTKPTTPSTNNNTTTDKENTNTDNKDNKNENEESSNTNTQEDSKDEKPSNDSQSSDTSEELEETE